MGRACSRKSAAMPTAAKPQKAESAGSCEVVPRTKAIASVKEVMVIETPALAIARAIRSWQGDNQGTISSCMGDD